MSSFHIGIDEAGRGPLIGDMVVAGVMANKDVISDLIKDGLVESKQLSSTERREIYHKALSKGVFVVAVYVSPWRIDRENLNKLEVEAIRWIIEVISKTMGGVHNSEISVYIDEVKGKTNIVKQTVLEYLQSRINEIRMESDADKKYPVVALASIFAKVLRDYSINLLEKLFGDFGSGYPADPRLEDWLKSIYLSISKPPLFIRRSWSNLSNKAPSWYISKKTVKHRTLFDFTKR